ncbi:NADPH-dependent FMN reductase [Aliicoccus persicus]|uniref:FMN-dependent NADPH-azoreductase n=1 Tax=Aliicoccus persicus TaxID=930138 RepID=A0A662Z569_9STAP|nr:NAD(P)H-dependent oxidoreductase [Aliicoccus persicus]SEW14082.1 NAD(P)H-dependent FMN reductase [Aliicoccus persicus]
MLKIGIILGSTREGRVSPAVAKWVKGFTEGNTEAEFEIVDIKDYNFEEFNNVPPAMLQKQFENENTTKWSQKIDALDGFIFVTPEYNKNISPSLKNAIDHLGTEWSNKVAGSVSYGSTLGVAATFALRQTLSNLGVAIVPAFGALSIFTDFENMTEFKPGEHHNDSINRMIDNVVLWAKAMKTIRQ